ncbi:MAG: hypothetical protein FWD68_21410 [Alphaproteobacteria bacterium]|nr:hypothetical protein [Alphaproteobacteria bacterium]
MSEVENSDRDLSLQLAADLADQLAKEHLLSLAPLLSEGHRQGMVALIARFPDVSAEQIALLVAAVPKTLAIDNRVYADQIRRSYENVGELWDDAMAPRRPSIT